MYICRVVKRDVISITTNKTLRDWKNNPTEVGLLIVSTIGLKRYTL